ncbi:MAG: methanogenesis marker 3 protein [Methanospirillum sp.]|nr:methanogenesis marker 3 protein [Methanospirillum sp.]
MQRIQLDAVEREVPDGTTLAEICTDLDPRFSVGVIRPSRVEAAETANVRLATSTGEVTIEVEPGERFPGAEALTGTGVQWADRSSVAFGPFPSTLDPARTPHQYRRGDVILGCGGYDPSRSFLILARARHSADYGAGADGGVIGTVVAGRAVMDRLAADARVEALQPVLSWADTTRSYTTADRSIAVEDGMEVVTRIGIRAEGYDVAGIDTATAASVEHLLLALEPGEFLVTRTASTHITEERLAGTPVPPEETRGRREGVVTIRTQGERRGCVYIYREDVPSSPHHTIVGRVGHGLELVKLAREGDRLAVVVEPSRFDLLGLPLEAASRIAEERKIAFEVDRAGPDRVVVAQEPGTTLDVLAAGTVSVTTVPFSEVVDIRLDESAAPLSVAVFREITGLKAHAIGILPFFFTFEDVYLFKPKIPRDVRLTPENPPVGESPGNALAITNDARKGRGMVGMRLSPSPEFGPTSEPFEGTNLVGTVIDTAKLKHMKVGKNVYIREVRP